MKRPSRLGTLYALAVLLAASGLHVRRRSGAPSAPSRRKKSGGGGRRRTPVNPPLGKAIKTSLRRAIAEGRVKQHADGSFRTKDGKYAGSDGTSRSGHAAEQRVHQQLKDAGFEVDTQQRAANTPTEIKGTYLSGPNRGQEFTLPPGTQRRYDGFVQKDGKWYGIETKSGKARLTPEQRAIDNWLNKPGNTMTVTTPDGKTREIHGVENYNVPN